MNGNLNFESIYLFYLLQHIKKISDIEAVF